MKKQVTKIPAAEMTVPQSRDAVSRAILEIGERQRERTRIAAAMNDEIAAVKARYESQAEPHNLAISALSKGIQIWCAANRDELTNGGKVKSHSFAGGEVRWRITPPRVVIRGAEAVLAALKKAGLTQFVRIKEEISKEAILADDEGWRGIPGISVQQTEEFVVVPFETTLEEVV